MCRSRSMASAVSTCSWPMTVSCVTAGPVSVQTSVEGALSWEWRKFCGRRERERWQAESGVRQRLASGKKSEPRVKLQNQQRLAEGTRTLTASMLMMVEL